jgi:hypothetical protein
MEFQASKQLKKFTTRKAIVSPAHPVLQRRSCIINRVPDLGRPKIRVNSPRPVDNSQASLNPRETHQKVARKWHSYRKTTFNKALLCLYKPLKTTW